MSVPGTVADMTNLVRMVTANTSSSSMTDAQILDKINIFNRFDLPAILKLQNLRVNYQFVTSANIPTYDFPTSLYLNDLPPVFIAGYQSYFTQTREAFMRLNPEMAMKQNNVATGNGTTGPYSFTVSPTPILRGWKRNPPGAFATGFGYAVSEMNYNVVVSSQDSAGNSVFLVDDGLGNLWDTADTTWDTTIIPARGTIDYLTGNVTCTFTAVVPAGQGINIQVIPYKASRPTAVLLFQDQIQLYPIPDDSYTVSFEAFAYPALLTLPTDRPQVHEWWQMIAYGASDKIFAQNGDFENMVKYRQLLDEQILFCQRRTLVQQSSDRVATIYSEQNSAVGQVPFAWSYSY